MLQICHAAFCAGKLAKLFHYFNSPLEPPSSLTAEKSPVVCSFSPVFRYPPHLYHTIQRDWVISVWDFYKTDKNNTVKQ